MSLDETEMQPAAARTAPDLHGRLIAQLRQRIVRGDMPAGVRVPEAHLCAQLDVSRTPLREALKALSVEGLVTLRPNRGAVVTPLDSDDLAAVFEAKGVIEQFIGLNAAEKASDEDLMSLQRLHDDLVAAEADEAHQLYTDLNEAFHHRMAQLAGNQEVLNIYERLQTKVLRARYQVNDDPKRVRQSLEEHEGIMAAMRIRARFDVADRLVAHNAATSQAIIDLVSVNWN